MKFRWGNRLNRLRLDNNREWRSVDLQQIWWALIWKDYLKSSNKISWKRTRAKTSTRNRNILFSSIRGYQSESKLILLKIKLAQRVLLFSPKTWEQQDHQLLGIEDNQVETTDRNLPWVQGKEGALYQPNKTVITNQQHLQQMPSPRGFHWNQKETMMNWVRYHFMRRATTYLIILRYQLGQYRKMLHLFWFKVAFARARWKISARTPILF